MRLLLDDNTPDQHRHQLTALEYHLRRIVQVAQTGIRQSHGAQREERQQRIGLHGNTSFVFAGSFQSTFHETEACVIGELDERQEPAVRLESVQREDQLLQVPVEQEEEEDAQTAEQKLCRRIVVGQIEAEDSHFRRRIRLTFAAVAVVHVGGQKGR